ncbi:MAG: PAS domain S-box protein [Desulfobulbus sp.]|nr:PAS domain S-box protein [Desulfobulbus sp.]
MSFWFIGCQLTTGYVKRHTDSSFSTLSQLIIISNFQLDDIDEDTTFPVKSEKQNFPLSRTQRLWAKTARRIISTPTIEDIHHRLPLLEMSGSHTFSSQGGTMNAQSSLDAKILEDVADALIFSDRAGVIVRWNRASSILFGFSAEETVGRNLDIIIPDHLRAAHWKGFHAAVTAGTMKLAGRPTLTRALHKSGRKLYIEMTFALVRGIDDEVLGSVAMARDVTERVERERAAKAHAAAPQNT